MPESRFRGRPPVVSFRTVPDMAATEAQLPMSGRGASVVAICSGRCRCGALGAPFSTASPGPDRSGDLAIRPRPAAAVAGTGSPSPPARGSWDGVLISPAGVDVATMVCVATLAVTTVTVAVAEVITTVRVEVGTAVRSGSRRDAGCRCRCCCYCCCCCYWRCYCCWNCCCHCRCLSASASRPERPESNGLAYWSPFGWLASGSVC